MDRRPPDFRVVQLTPPGRGAVATILVEGAEALSAVERFFRPRSGRPLASYPADQLVFGHFLFGPPPGEEVVIRRCAGDAVEIHCHGGQAVTAAILESLAGLGASRRSWQAWAADHYADPITAAAHLALAEARTERTAAILLDQYQGALRRAVEAIRQSLAAGERDVARRQIETVLARAGVGLRLTQPWRVVLAGSPNVGKSSLINALIGYRRAIVDPTPGTTRDVVTATTAVDGWPVELSDTAGLREPVVSPSEDRTGFEEAGSLRGRFRTAYPSPPPPLPQAERGAFDRFDPSRPTPLPKGARGVAEDAIEFAGMQLARRKLAEADLVVLVFDSSRPWSEADQMLVEAHPDALVVYNKSDLVPSAERERPSGLVTSASSGQGIETLLQTIAGRLVPEPPPPGAAVPFTQHQVDLLRSALAALLRSDPVATDLLP